VAKIVHKHDRAVRYFHWLNGLFLLVMIWSGLLIYWADDSYSIRLGTFEIHFFPEWFYQRLDLERQLAKGMAYHFLFMWFFGINGLLFAAYSLYSGHWRELLPNRRTPIEALHVVLHDLRIRKTPLPPGKFNAAQKIAYFGVVWMGFGSLVTGLAIYKPIQLSWLTSLMGGYELARFWHFLLTMGYLLFIVIHISQVVKAGWNNFRSMITGSELVEEGTESKHVHTS
jgi:thiosulfate reductase cytochrome b subunit